MDGGDSVIGTDADHRFTTAVVGLSEIWVTGVRRKRIASERDVSPTTQRGRSAEVSGDALPVVTGSAADWRGGGCTCAELT